MIFKQDYDVVVAGGGVAGVAAALEARRSGLKTAMVEKTIQAGGLATSGIVNIYLPLCDGLGNQVISGIAEELAHLSYRYGPGEVPDGWQEVVDGKAKARYRISFSPASFVLAMDEVLTDAGVDVWFDTLVCAPQMEGDRVVGIEVENKSGRGAIRAKCIIDATGDADVAFRAGAPCGEQDNWLSLWSLEASLNAARKATEKSNGDPLLCRTTLGAWNSGNNHPPGKPKFIGTDGRQVSDFVLESRKMLVDYYKNAYAEGGEKNRHNLFPLTLPTMAQFRTTRRIVGHATMSDDQHDLEADDSIGLVGDWRKVGYVWEIPYGTMVPQKVTGLLAAGRCISSEGDAWEVTRVISPVALTGQVAGIAATLAIQHDTTPDAIEARDIQQELERKGMLYRKSQVPRSQD